MRVVVCLVRKYKNVQLRILNMDFNCSKETCKMCCKLLAGINLIEFFGKGSVHIIFIVSENSKISTHPEYFAFQFLFQGLSSELIVTPRIGDLCSC